MNKLISIISIILFIGFTACEKEEPLKPNELARGLQGLDINPPSDGSGGGNGGGTGGGSNVNPFFRVIADGVLINSTNPFYQQAFGIYQVNSKLGSVNDIVQLNFFSEPTVGDQSASVQYIISAANTYSNPFATVTIDEVTGNKISGSFSFEVYSQGTPQDTILLTDGSFTVEK